MDDKSLCRENFFLQSYFCGQGNECVRFGSSEALARAKVNVERLYPVVGVSDRMNETLRVMEKKLPNVFVEGIARRYNGKTEVVHL